MSKIADAATAIAAARLARRPLAPLDEAIRPRDLAEALAMQAAVHARLSATRYGPRVGWKIGCTTKVMQDYLGISHPCPAGLFAGTMHKSGAALPHADFVRVGVECEIAVRLARSLEEGPFTPEHVASAIGAVMAAIEIVDDRYVDWQTIGTPTLVADDFFAAGAVLGPAVDPSSLPDLATLAGRTLVDGSEAGRGTGADVLGHPVNALAWLAGDAAGRGMPLKAGETVLLGSLVKTQWVPPGAEVAIEIDGLGRVAATFSA